MNEKLTPAQRKIVREIRRLHARKEPLDITAVGRRHPALLKAVDKVKPVWGWKQALRAAGLEVAEVGGILRRFPDAKAVVAAIQRRVAAQWPVTHSALFSGEHRDQALHWAAKKYFGAWRAALTAAGLEAAKAGGNTPRYPDAKAVVAEIQRRAAAGLSLSSASLLRGEQPDRALYRSARKCFASWRTALRLAGLDPPKVGGSCRRYPDAAAVVAEIRRRATARLPMTCSALVASEHPDVALYRSARQYFGSWPAAVKAAGFEVPKVVGRRRRYPDAKAVVAEIRRRAAAGLPLTWSGLHTREHRDQALCWTAGKHFGSWPAALHAAGLDPTKVLVRRRRYSDAAAVIAEIQRRAAAQWPLTGSKLFHGEHRDPSLHRNAERYFGSWPAALTAAGLEPAKICGRTRRYPDAAAVIAEIQRRVAAGLPLTWSGLNIGAHRNRSLYCNGRRLFGTWPAARLAAGAAKQGRSHAGGVHEEEDRPDFVPQGGTTSGKLLLLPASQAGLRRARQSVKTKEEGSK